MEFLWRYLIKKSRCVFWVWKWFYKFRFKLIVDNFTYNDLLELAIDNDMKKDKAVEIITKVVKTVETFENRAIKLKMMKTTLNLRNV